MFTGGGGGGHQRCVTEVSASGDKWADGHMGLFQSGLNILIDYKHMKETCPRTTQAYGQQQQMYSRK